VANLLVYIERSGNALARASLEVLAEGRRIATFLGATLYAVLPCGGARDPEAVATLGRRGADRVLLAAGEGGDGPALHATHGHMLAAAMARVPASLILLAATPAGHDLAPRAAARLGAAYVPEASLEYGPRGRLVLTRRVYGGGHVRRLFADDLERPLVVTLARSGGGGAFGDPIAEVMTLPPAPVASGVVEVGRVADPAAGLDTARVVVTAGAGIDPGRMVLVRALARALGAELGVTRAAVERGLESSDREIGIGGRQVAPRLYVACGASGSAEHLFAVAPATPIVAINRDPAAPIFRVARYGVIGDIAEVAPGLIAAASAKEARA
jgi:electron transfer flavoprotein alpha subunit